MSELWTAEVINAHLAAGGQVRISTMTRHTIYSKRHAGWFSGGADGVYVRHGKGKNYLGRPGKFLVGVALSK